MECGFDEKLVEVSNGIDDDNISVSILNTCDNEMDVGTLVHAFDDHYLDTLLEHYDEIVESDGCDLLDDTAERTLAAAISSSTVQDELNSFKTDESDAGSNQKPKDSEDADTTEIKTPSISLNETPKPFAISNTPPIPSNHIPNRSTKHLNAPGFYRDLSTMTDEEAVSHLNYTHMKGRAKEPFPQKLHLIIEYSERDGYSAIISWMPHGRSFKIHNETLFVKKIMPLYFFQSKLSSFQRQLRDYGFNKIKGHLNADQGAYFHVMFLRGRPMLARGIIRVYKPVPLHRKDEPNLYLFPPMPSSDQNASLASLDAENAQTAAPRMIQYSNPNPSQEKVPEKVSTNDTTKMISTTPKTISDTNALQSQQNKFIINKTRDSLSNEENTVAKGNNSIIQFVRNMTTPTKQSHSYNAVNRVFTL